MKETKGFQLDRGLSTNEHFFFHNPRTNESIVSFRGTASKKDLGTDLKVLVSKELDSQRIKVSENVMEKVIEKYGKSIIRVTGHSLGSNISLHVGEKYNIHGYYYSSAMFVRQTNQSIKKGTKQMIYRTHADPISVMNEFQKGNTNREVVRVKVNAENTTNIINHHKMENFYSDKAVVSRHSLMVVEKATAETVLVRSALKAAELVDLLIIAVVVGYEAHDYVKNIKKLHNYNEFVNLNYETAGKIISDILHIEKTYNVIKDTGNDFTVDKNDDIDHIFDKEKALTSQIMSMFNQRKKEDSMRKDIDTITKMRKGEYKESADGHALVSSNGTILVEQPHHTVESITEKHTDPIKKINP